MQGFEARAAEECEVKATEDEEQAWLLQHLLKKICKRSLL